MTHFPLAVEMFHVYYIDSTICHNVTYLIKLYDDIRSDAMCNTIRYSFIDLNMFTYMHVVSKIHFLETFQKLRKKIFSGYW